MGSFTTTWENKLFLDFALCCLVEAGEGPHQTAFVKKNKKKKQLKNRKKNTAQTCCVKCGELPKVTSLESGFFVFVLFF